MRSISARRRALGADAASASTSNCARALRRARAGPAGRAASVGKRFEVDAVSLQGHLIRERIGRQSADRVRLQRQRGVQELRQHHVRARIQLRWGMPTWSYSRRWVGMSSDVQVERAPGDALREGEDSKLDVGKRRRHE